MLVVVGQRQIAVCRGQIVANGYCAFPALHGALMLALVVPQAAQIVLRTRSVVRMRDCVFQCKLVLQPVREAVVPKRRFCKLNRLCIVGDMRKVVIEHRICLVRGAGAIYPRS